MTPARRLFAGLLALVAGAAASAQIPRLGAIGDSLSDEYAEESYSYARNWTMQLVQYRGLTMGPTATQAAQPGGTWGEPRRTQYQSNWARYGDGTSEMIAHGQHTGLAAQVAPLGISHAVVMIGANDFNSVGFGAYFSIYNGSWSTTQINTFVNQRLADTRAALDALAPTGVHLVMINVFDFGITPITWGSPFYSNASKRDRVTAVIQQLNTGLLSMAQEYHLVLVDAFALAQTVWGTNSAPKSTLLVGNVAIQLRQADTSSHGNPLAAFVHDSVHPHTVPQGVLANTIIEALNEAYHTGLAPFSEQEILTAAGLTYGGQDTLAATTGPLSAYIRNFACYPNCDNSSTAPVLNVADFTCFLQKYAGNDPYANCDASTTPPLLNVADFTCFLQQYATGCP